MNSESLEQIISDYKKDFSRISSEEVYKWEAIQWFQEHWDINAENFTEMLTNSFAKADNLLTARNYFPKGMLIEFSNKDPEAVRFMFQDLFNESKDVVERVDTFIRISQDLLEIRRGIVETALPNGQFNQYIFILPLSGQLLFI